MILHCELGLDSKFDSVIDLKDNAFLFRVIFCLVFAAYGVGQSLSLVPDYDKAKRAALSVTKLLDVIPLIDNLSSLGKNMVRKRANCFYFTAILQFLSKLSSTSGIDNLFTCTA